MKKLNHAVFALILALAMFALPSGRALAGSDTPRRLMDKFHEVLMDVMRDSKLGYSDRYNRLMSAVEQAFHLPVMTQISAGSYWREAPAIQKQLLITAFTHYGVSLFARTFSGDSIKRFETLGERPGPQNTTLVDARLVRKNGSDIDLTYVLKSYAGSWRVVDVLLDKGISELTVRRSEFSHGLANGGLPALAATLNRKADDLGKQ